MHRSCYLLASLMAAVLAVPSAAQEAGNAFYLTPADVDLVHVLAPPPAVDSPAGKADLQTVLAAVQSRTDAEITHAQADDERNVFRFADVMGPNFRTENLPLATQTVPARLPERQRGHRCCEVLLPAPAPLCRRSRHQNHRRAGAGFFLSEQSFDLRV